MESALTIFQRLPSASSPPQLQSSLHPLLPSSPSPSPRYPHLRTPQFQERQRAKTDKYRRKAGLVMLPKPLLVSMCYFRLSLLDLFARVILVLVNRVFSLYHIEKENHS